MSALCEHSQPIPSFLIRTSLVVLLHKARVSAGTEAFWAHFQVPTARAWAGPQQTLQRLGGRERGLKSGAPGWRWHAGNF